jgi:hypothetical protein
VALPELGASEVLVRTHAVGVNPLDLRVKSSLFFLSGVSVILCVYIVVCWMIHACALLCVFVCGQLYEDTWVMFLSPFGKQSKSLFLCLQVLCFYMSHTCCQAFLPDVTLLTSRGESC